jgi:trimethylamine--corrinoid protein Co-methyltransferase
MNNYETAFWSSELADNEPFEKWELAGSVDAATRANQKWKKVLAEYEAPPLDPAIDAALTDFIARRKASMADAWY